MAEIWTFSGLRYRDDIDLSAVTCPPYDVLSPAERAALQERSPFAMARLILPTGEGDARYQNAGDLLAQWMANGVLRTDPLPAIYVTRTEFAEPGSDGSIRKSRLGFVALLRLHEYTDRIVLPHERTLSAPKEDRLKLLQATHANIESIMGLVDDETGALFAEMQTALAQQPLVDFTGDDDQRHTLYAITDPSAIARIQGLVAAQPVFIADGHHRYETSVAYARELGLLGSDAPEAFLMATLTTFTDPGLSVLPTHRLVRGTTPALLHTLFRHLEPHFEILDVVDAADLEGRLRLSVANQPVFGLAMPSGALHLLTPRDADALRDALPADMDPSLSTQEAVLMQYLILEPVLGISAAEVATSDRLAYTRDAEDAIHRVREGEFDLALLLGRPAVTAVRDVSLADNVMPQKSTFFYPKLLSGLILRKF